MLAVLAAGCGGGDDDAARASGDVSGTVRLFAFGDPEELQAFKNVITAFEQEEPDVDVQLVETSDRDDLIARVSTSIAGGKPPELFLINYRFFGQFAARDVLEPLEPRLEQSDVFEEDDFYPGPLDAFRFGEDRTITCLPQNASSLVLYYNRDLFKAAGVPEPEDDWTWKDFTDRAVALTKDTNGDGTTDVYGAGIEPSLIRLAPFLWSNGAELVKDDLSGFDLETPEAAEVLDQFFSLHVNYRAIPGEEEEESENSEARFLNGRMAMYFDSRRATPGFRTITGLRLGRRAAAEIRRAGVDPSLRRVLHAARRGEQGRGLALRRVRARPGRPADHRRSRPHGPVAQGRREHGCLPRPEREAEPVAGLPRQPRPRSRSA